MPGPLKKCVTYHPFRVRRHRTTFGRKVSDFRWLVYAKLRLTWRWRNVGGWKGHQHFISYFASVSCWTFTL